MRAVCMTVAGAIVASACGSVSAQPGRDPTPQEIPPVTVSPVTVIGRRPVQPTAPRLELYEERDLGGAGVILVRPAPNLMTRGFADRARSARAYGAWELCDGPDFQPPCRVVDGDEPFLGSTRLSERISSARPAAGR